VEIYTPRGVEKLKSGRTMLVRGSTTEPEYQMVEAASRDNWDEWNEDRDKRLERSRSYEYVSRDVYGVDDLDYHGRWVHVAPYGMVWSPYGVGAGWAPYRHGRWVWVDWYGWTWVSYDSWGWAPFHYGRWFHHGPYGWCWYPGPRYSRHYWRPALVAFFGVGVGPVHVGVGFGRIGWVPLAPYEPYHRWYGRNIYHGYRGGRYVDNSVRIVNNVNITNVYRNSRVVNGVTGADHGDFIRGGRGRAIGNDELRGGRARLVQGALPVTPGRESLRLADREVRNVPVARATPDRFYSRRQPVAVDRVPFDEQRRGVEQMTRRSFSGERGGDAPRQAAETRQAAPAQAGGDSRGWRRLGESRSASEPAAGMRSRESLVTRPEAQQGGDNAGWRRFGDRGAERSQEPVRVRPEPRSESGESGGWRRFEGGGASRSEEPRARRENAPEARGETGGERRFEGGSERRESQSPRWSGGSDREAVRVNPPIVRERSAPRGESGGWNRGGGEVRSAPRMDRGSSGGWNRGGGGGGGEVRSAPRGGGSGGSRGGGGNSGGGGGEGRVRGGGRNR
jgi:hypothetical protein